jgi:hypothetical protein
MGRLDSHEAFRCVVTRRESSSGQGRQELPLAPKPYISRGDEHALPLAKREFVVAESTLALSEARSELSVARLRLN